MAIATVCFIKVWLDGVEEPVVFSVSKEESDRFQRNYEERRHGFFVFDTQAGTHVALNLKHVQIANLLWNQTQHVQPKDAECSDWINLHLRNRSSIASDVGEPVDLADALFMMESDALDGGEILSFTDADGEIVMFDPAALLYLEAPATLVKDGEAKMRERDEIADEPEPKPKRRKGRAV